METINKLLIFIFTTIVMAGSAYSQTPREELKQMVRQLQQSPNDNALRVVGRRRNAVTGKSKR